MEVVLLALRELYAKRRRDPDPAPPDATPVPVPVKGEAPYGLSFKLIGDDELAVYRDDDTLVGFIKLVTP